MRNINKVSPSLGALLAKLSEQKEVRAELSKRNDKLSGLHDEKEKLLAVADPDDPIAISQLATLATLREILPTRIRELEARLKTIVCECEAIAGDVRNELRPQVEALAETKIKELIKVLVPHLRDQADYAARTIWHLSVGGVPITQLLSELNVAGGDCAGPHQLPGCVERFARLEAHQD